MQNGHLPGEWMLQALLRPLARWRGHGGTERSMLAHGGTYGVEHTRTVRFCLVLEFVTCAPSLRSVLVAPHRFWTQTGLPIVLPLADHWLLSCSELVRGGSAYHSLANRRLNEPKS